MSAKKHAVKVMIGGEEYTVRSDLPPEYTREVAALAEDVAAGAAQGSDGVRSSSGIHRAPRGAVGV